MTERKGQSSPFRLKNEMGYANTDRDYSCLADRDYEKPVPEALKDVELPDSGKESIPADSAVSPWKKTVRKAFSRSLQRMAPCFVYKRNRGSGKRDFTGSP